VVADEKPRLLTGLLVYFLGGALFLPPPDGLLVLLFVGQPAGFGPLLGGIGAGRPPPPLFPPLALLIV